MKNTSIICIDLAKSKFQAGLFNKHNILKSNKQYSESALLKFVAMHPEAIICMEACATSNYLGRYFQNQGHKVLLIPAQVVAKYRLGNKNDANDVLAIYEAANRPKVKFVAVKTIEQQDLAALLKLRESYVKRRTQLSNRIRGVAMEYAVKMPQGLNQLRKNLPVHLSDMNNDLTHIARFVLSDLYEQLIKIDENIAKVTTQLIEFAKQIPSCQLLITLPGVGWIVASGLYSRFGDASMFRFGRDASASLGLVPAHNGTGGKNVNIGISKSGDRTLRSLVVHGARAVVSNIKEKQDPLSFWIRELLKRNHPNKATIAVANKIVRMACAMLKTSQPYQPQFAN